MHKKPSKKDVEISQLNRFRDAIPDFPSGEVEPDEEPDFVVSSPTGRVGIELVRLFQEATPGAQPRQQAESLRTHVCRKAQHSFEGSGGSSHQVFVHFSQSTSIANRRVPEIAKALARIVHDLAVPPGQAREIEYDWVNRDSLPEEIIKVRAWRPEREMRSIWQAMEADWMPKCSRALLQERIANKELLLPKYRKKADEIWLLLVADGSTISTSFEPPNPVEVGSFKTDFTRLYYFDNLHKFAVPL